MQAVDGGFEGFGVIVADAVGKLNDLFDLKSGGSLGSVGSIGWT